MTDAKSVTVKMTPRTIDIMHAIKRIRMERNGVRLTYSAIVAGALDLNLRIIQSQTENRNTEDA